MLPFALNLTAEGTLIPSATVRTAPLSTSMDYYLAAGKQRSVQFAIRSKSKGVEIGKPVHQSGVAI